MDDKEYQRNLPTLTENSMINKVNEFQQSIEKNDKYIDSFELINLIIHRHLLYKIFEGVNKVLRKDNRQFRIDFDGNVYDYFDKLSYKYFQKEGCITDNGFLYFKAGEELYALDLLIRHHTNDKELRFILKRVKCKLAICRVDLKD